jgi:hypothetical protein
VGGPFLRGHRLVIEPLEGQVTWDGQPILDPVVSDFKVEGLIEVRQMPTRKTIDAGMATLNIWNATVEAFLPMDVHLLVNRWPYHLDVKVTMKPQPEGQGGQCGNFNGDASDDTPEQINARDSAQVAPEDLVFARADFGYVGCFRDRMSDRDLPVSRRQKSLEDCALACSGFQYFGRQYDNECWCGDTFGKHGPDTDCTCRDGDDYQGGNHNCVYRYGGREAVRPSALEAKHPPLSECPAELRASAEESCRRGLVADSSMEDGADAVDVDPAERLEACIFDVCFGGKQS